MPGISQKISQLANGNPPQLGDLIPIARAGANYFLDVGSIASTAEIVLSGSTDAYGGSIQAAINALPAAGGTIDARAAGVAAVPQGVIAQGTKVVHIILGPYNYTVTQFVVTGGFCLSGAGPQFTNIQTPSGTTAALFVLAQANNEMAFGCKFERFACTAVSGNGDCFFLDSSGFSNSGFEYTVMSQVWVENFPGNAVHFKSTPTSALSASQFSIFDSVIVFSPSTRTGSSLRVEGYAGQLSFSECEFDGGPQTNTAPNIYLGTGSGTASYGPLTTYFRDVTVQGGSIGIQLDGVNTCIIDGLHSEGCQGVLLVTPSGLSGASGNANIVLANSYIAGTSAVNSGNGYILKCTDGFASITLQNIQFGQPDNFVLVPSGSPSITCLHNKGFSNYNTYLPPSLGVTNGITAAASVFVGASRTCKAISSGTSIQNIYGYHMPGELITFYASGGSVNFSTGGNISLGGASSPLTLSVGQTITFVRVDGAATAWVPVSSSRSL